MLSGGDFMTGRLSLTVDQDCRSVWRELRDASLIEFLGNIAAAQIPEDARVVEAQQRELSVR